MTDPKNLSVTKIAILDLSLLHFIVHPSKVKIKDKLTFFSQRNMPMVAKQDYGDLYAFIQFPLHTPYYW